MPWVLLSMLHSIQTISRYMDVSAGVKAGHKAGLGGNISAIASLVLRWTAEKGVLNNVINKLVRIAEARTDSLESSQATSNELELTRQDHGLAQLHNESSRKLCTLSKDRCGEHCTCRILLDS